MKLFKVKGALWHRCVLWQKHDCANGHQSNSDVEIKLSPSDGVSQVSSDNKAASNSFVVAHCIGVERKLKPVNLAC